MALGLRFAAHGRGSDDAAGGEVLDALVGGGGSQDDDVAWVLAGADYAEGAGGVKGGGHVWWSGMLVLLLGRWVFFIA